MSLLREVDAVIGKRDVPFPGVGKADAHSLRQGLTEPGEGAEVVDELRAGDPFAQGHRRRCDQQDPASIQRNACEEPLQPLGGLLRTSALEQIVGSQHDDQQIRAGGEGGGGGGDLPAVLPQVADGPAGFPCQNVHPPAVRVIPPAEIAPRVVAVGVGIAEADDVHRPFSFLRMRLVLDKLGEDAPSALPVLSDCLWPFWNFFIGEQQRNYPSTFRLFFERENWFIGQNQALKDVSINRRSIVLQALIAACPGQYVP